MEESEASINSWFTPTILFIFLNLMIATILFTSNLPNNNNNNNNKQKQKQEPQPNQSKLPRSQSILHRLKSFNLYPQISQQQHEQHEALEIAATQYVFNHLFPHEQDLLQPLEKAHTNNLDLDPTRLDHTNEVPPSNIQTHFVVDRHTVEKVITHFDFGPTRIENDELQSLDEVYSSITDGQVNKTKSDTIPTSGELKMKKSASMKSPFSHFEEDKIVEARRPATVRERDHDDVEVDIKADDFINKFKHQLKLQRMDSIIRYKDMVNRETQK